MMKTDITQVMVKEHQLILRMIALLERNVALMEQGRFRNWQFFIDAVDFIRNYADRFHHAKEEDILFIEMAAVIDQGDGCLHCNPIPQMLHEHDLGRNFLQEMKMGLSKGDQKKIISAARGYAYLLQDHIFKEDNILYPMADQILTNDSQNLILGKFKLSLIHI